jgi:3-dehydroquinate synthase
LNLERKVFILTDDGVPDKYAKQIEILCKNAIIHTVSQGEGSKSISTLEGVLSAMADAELGRGDCLVAVGGGVVGDLGGFAASIYMRGIDFYNVPTTLLSQVDSSIGGKTAVNLGGIKNIVGSFKQPKAVLIDPEVLSTLPKRHLRNGLCEAIKMAATSNASLFEMMESMSEYEIFDNVENIIVEALKIKKSVVEADEKEGGLRKILNFGHTLGHGIEANEALCGLYHGECVALGMLPMCSKNVSERLENVLKKYNLPTKIDISSDALMSYIKRDKKAKGNKITAIYIDKIGTFRMLDIEIDDMKKYIDGGIL